MGVAGGVTLFHVRKQLLPYWKNVIKISHAQSNTNSLEVNDNSRESKIILELNLNCIAMKLKVD